MKVTSSNNLIAASFIDSGLSTLPPKSLEFSICCRILFETYRDVILSRSYNLLSNSKQGLILQSGKRVLPDPVAELRRSCLAKFLDMCHVRKGNIP